MTSIWEHSDPPEGMDALMFERLKRIYKWKKLWGFDSEPIDGLRPKSPLPQAGAKDDTNITYSSTGKEEGTNVSDNFDFDKAEKRDAYDPSEGRIAKGIDKMFKSDGVVARAAAADQITGKKYSQTRRDELNQRIFRHEGRDEVIGGHYLIDAYGLRATDEHANALIDDVKTKDPRVGLRIDNPSSTKYMRNRDKNEIKANIAFRQAIEKHVKDAGDVTRNFDKSMFVVNTPDPIAALEILFPKGGWREYVNTKGAKGNQVKGPCRPIGKGTGLYLLEFENPTHAEFRGKMLDACGMTPPVSAAIKAGLDTRSQDPLADTRMRDEDLDNSKSLAVLFDNPAVDTMRKMPDSHPMKATAVSIMDMIEGLKGPLLDARKQRSAEFDENILIDSALTQLDRLLSTLPSCADEPMKFHRLYEIAVEEMSMLLSVCKPYKSTDYRTTSKNIVTSRAPCLGTLGDTSVSCHLLSGGMDAITTAVGMSFKLLEQSGLQMAGGGDGPKGAQRNPQYFEANSLFSDFHVSDKGAEKIEQTGARVIKINLNPSTPIRKVEGAHVTWTPENVVTTIEACIKAINPKPSPDLPAVIVLDITVEKNGGEGSDLDKVCGAFLSRVDDGTLSLMLCKSYQKHATMGTGKVMAGGLTVISKEQKLHDAAAARENETTPFAESDDAQMMTHFLAAAAEDEIRMLEAGARNAELAASMVSIKKPDKRSDQFNHDQGLPFIVVPKDDMRPKLDSFRFTLRPKDLMSKMGIYDRSSFGFQKTSLTMVDNGLRLSCGQEPKPAMYEKLFAPCQTMADRDFTIQDIDNLAAEAVDEGFNELVNRKVVSTTALVKLYVRQEDPPRPDEDEDTWKARVSGRLAAAKKEWKALTKSASSDGKSSASSNSKKKKQPPAKTMDPTKLKWLTAARMEEVAAKPAGKTEDVAELRARRDFPAEVNAGKHDDQPLPDAISCAANKVASCALMQLAIHDARETAKTKKTQPAEWPVPHCAEMIDSLLATNLRGISDETAMQLCFGRVQLADEKKLVEVVRMVAPLMPYAEGPCRLLDVALPDAVFADLHEGEKLCAALLEKAGIADRMTLIEELVKQRKVAKALACVAALRKKIVAVVNEFKSEPTLDYIKGGSKLSMELLGTEGKELTGKEQKARIEEVLGTLAIIETSLKKKM